MRTNLRKLRPQTRDAEETSESSRTLSGKDRGLGPRLTAALSSIFFIALIIMGLCLRDADAHRVNVFAYVEGDALMVEGYFSAKSKAMNCPVELYDSSGKKLAETKTDTKGLGSFRIADLPPFEGDLKVVLVAGTGHKAEYSLPASELPGKASDRKPAAAEQEKTTAEPTASAPKSAPKEAQAVPAMDEQRLAGLLDQALDKRIGPVVKMIGNQQKLLLELQQQGPGLTGIIGGIGWIFGLIGVAAYFMSRKQRRQ